MMIGDVTVVGLDTMTTVLLDIGMDVPHRVVVTIPADKATLSKDLWRAISQRRVFQLHAGPVSQAPIRPIVPPMAVDGWQTRCHQLESENTRLREQVAELQRQRPATEVVLTAPPIVPVLEQGKIDEILSILKAGIPTVSAPTQVGAVRSSQSSPTAVVEVDVPAFIPSEIKPKDIEGRLTEVQSETSETANLGSAASALRKFRKGSQ
jgi:hypothetical protein